jgi:carboxymethylenebutenolidase
MQSATVEVRTADGVADAYVTRPDGDGGLPGVLFIMDAIGLRPRIEEMADRVAAQGYVVLAPNVFYRAGRASELPLPAYDPADRAAFMAAVRPLLSQLTPEATARDGAAYLDYLSGAAPGPVGITGYCMGGRLGWRVAAAYPDRVAALGCFHTGGLVSDAPDSPHRSADRLKAELYLGYADQDPSMTPEQIALLERALDEAGARYRSERYEGALHGYTMSDTPVYDEAATERHFSELCALLERTLRQG